MEFYLDERARRKRRRILKFKIYGSLTIFLLLAGGAVYSVIYTPIFKVKNIGFTTVSAGVPEFFTAQALESTADFKNDEELNKEIVGDFKFFFTKHSKLNSLLGADNILIWNEKFIPDDYLAKNHPQIAGLKMEKDYIERQIKISLSKRQKLGIWCKTQKNQEIATSTNIATSMNGGEISQSVCFWFDRDGIIFEDAPTAEGNLIYRVDDYSGRTMSFGEKVLENDFLTNLLKIFEVLEKSGLKIKFLSLDNLALREIIAEPLAASLPKVYFSLKIDPSFGLAALTSFKDIDLSGIEYIDLRVPGRAYYKLK